MNDHWEQHRVSHDGRAWQALKVLLVFFAVDLVWEVIRANLDQRPRADWPWRFTVLDPSTAATLVALLAGLLAARSQYAQTMLPVLSWSAREESSDFIARSVRTIRLFNAGGGRATVKHISYRFQMKDAPGEEAQELSPWLSALALVETLMDQGFTRDDMHVLFVGPGGAIPMTSDFRQGLELVAFSSGAIDRLLFLDVMVQVVDALGHVHEKKLRCLRTLGVNIAVTNKTAP